MIRLLGALGALAIFCALTAPASAQSVTAPGCDGRQYTVQAANTMQQCMANGPILHCSRSQTLVYCSRKFNVQISPSAVGYDTVAGCDGVKRRVRVALTMQQCMANAPALRCPVDQAEAYCKRKFGG